MNISRRIDVVYRQGGYSMIEILISLLIGAVLIGAVLIAVSGSGLSGRKQSGHAQLGEDGQIALNLLASQLRMAGFLMPTSTVPSLHTEQRMLFGCRNGFADVTVANFGALTCASGTGNDSVAVRYDARAPGTVPADCLGATASIPTAGPLAGWVDNRFYIATSPSGNPALFCRGNGGQPAQMLIDNVEALQVRYGIAVRSPVPDAPELFERAIFAGQTVRYVRADDLLAACPKNVAASNSWCSVTVVRVCLVMRTGERVSEDAGGTPFMNCNGALQTIADTRLRRAMVTTISLRNRMP